MAGKAHLPIGHPHCPLKPRRRPEAPAVIPSVSEGPLLMASEIPHGARDLVSGLRGPASEVRALVAETTSQRGVCRGQFHLLPVQVEHCHHAHGGGRHGHIRV